MATHLPQTLQGIKFVIINSITTKHERNWLERIFSFRPLQKYRYTHTEIIADDVFYGGNGVSYCNGRTFAKLKRQIQVPYNETVRTR